MKEKEDKTMGGIGDNEVYIIGSDNRRDDGGGSFWKRYRALLAAIFIILLVVGVSLWLFYRHTNNETAAVGKDNVEKSASGDVKTDSVLDGTHGGQRMKPILVSPDDVIHEVVDEMPTFSGGDNELFTFLARNMKYPKEAEAKGQEGRVIVTFVIKSDGSIGDIRVAKGVCESIDAEAIRVIKAMPKWIPGKENGKPVNVRYSIPIVFRLN